MHARSSPCEKAPDRSVRPHRREQLDAPVADQDGRGEDTLVRKRLPVLGDGPEEPLVGRHRLVEVGDRHTEMMNATRLHAGAIVSGRY